MFSLRLSGNLSPLCPTFREEPTCPRVYCQCRENPADACPPENHLRGLESGKNLLLGSPRFYPHQILPGLPLFCKELNQLQDLVKVVQLCQTSASSPIKWRGYTWGSPRLAPGQPHQNHLGDLWHSEFCCFHPEILMQAVCKGAWQSVIDKAQQVWGPGNP